MTLLECRLIKPNFIYIKAKKWFWEEEFMFPYNSEIKFSKNKIKINKKIFKFSEDTDIKKLRGFFGLSSK